VEAIFGGWHVQPKKKIQSSWHLSSTVGVQGLGAGTQKKQFLHISWPKQRRALWNVNKIALRHNQNNICTTISLLSHEQHCLKLFLCYCCVSNLKETLNLINLVLGPIIPFAVTFLTFAISFMQQ